MRAIEFVKKKECEKGIVKCVEKIYIVQKHLIQGTGLSDEAIAGMPDVTVDFVK